MCKIAHLALAFFQIYNKKPQSRIKLNLTNMMCTQQRKHLGVGGESHMKQKQREKKTREGQEEKQKHKLKSKVLKRRGEKPMEEQNKVNEEKDRNLQRQETEVGEEAIRKMGGRKTLKKKRKKQIN